MSEWEPDETGMPGDGDSGSRKKNDYTGGLNIGMAIACFLAVTAVSFLTSWLMKDAVRSFWQMGLTFAAPFAALMGSAMLTEQITGRMTPQCSRNAQMICILVTVAAAFAVGCLAEVTHQPVVIEKTEPEFDYLIIADKSGSMAGSMEKSSREAIHDLIDTMEDGTNVGIVAFGSTVVGEQKISPLDSEQRAKLDDVINMKVSGGTNFSDAMDRAMRLVEMMPERTRSMRIILVTDGDEMSRGNFDQFNIWASRLNADPGQENIELCAIQVGDVPMLDMVKHAVNLSGGTIYDRVQAGELASQLHSLKVTTRISEPVDTLKATYDGQTADGKPNTPYMILTCVLLIIQGVLCGIALKIMFSVQGQFRFQTILSPLMGLAAFLLLNFGRYTGISPAWVCEGIALSAFGLVFMRENLITGQNRSASASPGQKKKTSGSAKTVEAFDDDF